MHDYFKSNKRALKLINYSFNENFLSFRVKEPVFSLPVERIQQILDEITVVMEEHDVPQSACVVCGQTASHLGLYYGLYAYLHKDCTEKDPVDFTTLKDAESGAAETGEGASAAAEGAATEAEGAATEADGASAAADAGIDRRPMDTYLPAMTDALAALCRIPSVKGEPAPGAPYGRDTLAALEAFLDLGEQLGMKAVNLDGHAGYVEAGSGDRLVAALCHLDVVPGGEGWTVSAFEPQILTDRIVARGAIDDKGPAVAALFALKALIDEGGVLNSRIRIIVGLDEESGSACIEHYVQTAELPDAGFTPDADFPVIYAEKGIAWYRLSARRTISGARGVEAGAAALRVIAAQAGNRPNMVPDTCILTYIDDAGLTTVERHVGRSAHGSRPADGDNAIAKAFAAAAIRLENANASDPFINAFNRLIASTTDGSLAGIDGSDESGSLTLNAGVLALDADNATLDIDIRYPVTWQLADLDQRLRAATAPHGIEVTLLREQAPLFAPRDLPLVQDLMHVYAAITGDAEAQPLAIGGGTYARSMPNIVAFGPGFPGDPDSAHQADESISFETFEKAARIYREAFRVLAG